MIRAQKIFQILNKEKVEFFTGVPDSLLKDFCQYVEDNTEESKHIIAANEGGAVALASGFHLGTGGLPLVYMQNSGLGNAINPLVSLAHKNVYSTPMILMIGWRGEPGSKDEPQHKTQGEITLNLLETIGVPYVVLPQEENEAEKAIIHACENARTKNIPFAIVVREGTIVSNGKQKVKEDKYPLTREEALNILIKEIEEDAVIVSTTGKISRELFEIRKRSEHGHHKDFLTVGSMGHASQIALGIALVQPERLVYCFDGDGASIMHLGSYAIIGQKKPNNFRHIVFNNEAHESVGGQKTAAKDISLSQIARSCGYPIVLNACKEEDILTALGDIQKNKKLSFLEINIKCGSRDNLGRPTRKPEENKFDFMQNLLGKK